MVRLLLILSIITLAVAQENTDVIQGTKCAKNQVVNKITVFEDGAIEAECGPIPCSTSGTECTDNSISCKGHPTEVFSGMKWAPNGESIRVRCCNLMADSVIYIGTDVVTLGNYYTGGLITQKNLYGSAGPEYDFISNVRLEQGGVRIWVNRIMCPADKPHSQILSNAQKSGGVKGSYEQRRQQLLQTLAERQTTSADSNVGETRRLQ
uniref:G8 domain-containing protein n=1 Tax=Rhabditophanes sp. KR3021 TaxID=114890 RepID=A0AC35TXG4_9BILA